MAKRGRPTTEDRERLAATLIRTRQIKPEQCDPVLAYPGVQAPLKQPQSQDCGGPMVVQVLSEGALEDVYREAKAVRSLEYRQLATFLRLFSSRRKNVSAVAREMGLSRMYVVRSIQPRALSLLGRRFLYWAEQTDPMRASATIQGLKHHQEAS